MTAPSRQGSRQSGNKKLPIFMTIPPAPSHHGTPRRGCQAVRLYPPAAVSLLASAPASSEVGFRQRSRRHTDRHRCRSLAVDNCPAPFEQRQGDANEIDNTADERRGLHFLVT